MARLRYEFWQCFWHAVVPYYYSVYLYSKDYAHAHASVVGGGSFSFLIVVVMWM